MKEEMTDQFIFERFMDLMDMYIENEYTNKDNKIIIYSDEFNWTEFGETNVTKYGYDHFVIGGEFDKNGALVRGFMDSHVAYMSKNREILTKLGRLEKK